MRVEQGQLWAHVNNTYVVQVLNVDGDKVYYASEPNKYRSARIDRFLEMFERVYKVVKR